MFFACGIWYVADVLSMSPLSIKLGTDLTFGGEV